MELIAQHSGPMMMRTACCVAICAIIFLLSAASISPVRGDGGVTAGLPGSSGATGSQGPPGPASNGLRASCVGPVAQDAYIRTTPLLPPGAAPGRAVPILHIYQCQNGRWIDVGVAP